MSPTYNLSLHIFRRDLRLQDNSTLIAAQKSSKQVIPCFILDERQVSNNPYKSDNAIQFMLASLTELDLALRELNSKLFIFYGISEEIIAKLITENPIEAVFLHRDYTPFSQKRDNAIASICAKNQIDYHAYADLLLHEPEQILKSDQTPYTIYTPATKYARQWSVDKPEYYKDFHFYQGQLKGEDKTHFDALAKVVNPNLYLPGGRKAAIKLLNNIKHIHDYQEQRNYPALSATSHLSAHNKFGTVSIREVYWKIVKEFSASHTLINELYWRDFFTHIAFHFPKVFSGAFLAKFQDIKWSNNEDHFKAWTEGQTGFPIVDAGMRELNTTGYMHNRVRMIVASFLCKDLHINWREGEKYFAQKLVDYDAAVNNGNWQWAASTGCDAQPYFRIFNPWLQQQKFDPECVYIKRWIPELVPYENKVIHRWYLGGEIRGYPMPMVDHKMASKQALSLYLSSS